MVKCSGVDQKKGGMGPVPYLLENSQETIGIFFMVGVMVGEGSVRGEGLWLLQRIGKGKNGNTVAYSNWGTGNSTDR